MTARGTLALLCGLTLVGTGTLHAREPLPRPSLAGLSRIGAVIVTASADTIDEATARRAVERRLARAGILIDEGAAPELLVNISAERTRTESGTCQCGNFRVLLSLREPVVLERDPGHPYGAVTWSRGSSNRVFNTKAPVQALQDSVEDAISAFLQTVKSDTEAVRE